MRVTKNNINTIFNFVENEEVREKLYNSEDRIRRSFNVLFSGYSLKAEDLLNDVTRVKDYSGIVEIRDINFYSYCEHHFAPFFGKASVYYQPNEIITGLGKVVRLVHDLHARKLQIQEVMTRDIAMDIYSILHAKGVYVETTAKHLCMCSRGPSDDDAYTTVKFGIGTLEHLYLK